MTTLAQRAQSVRVNPHHISPDVIFRWSPRSMTGEKLSDEEVTALFEASRYAPSAFNDQPWRFYYCARDSKGFQDVMQILAPPNQEWCKNASHLCILVSKNTFDRNDKPNRTHTFDTGAAWEAFAIEGTRRNMVVHGMSGFDYDKAKEYLKLDDHFTVECMIAVGKPSEGIASEDVSLRRPLEEIAIEIP